MTNFFSIRPIREEEEPFAHVQASVLGFDNERFIIISYFKLILLELDNVLGVFPTSLQKQMISGVEEYLVGYAVKCREQPGYSVEHAVVKSDWHGNWISGVSSVATVVTPHKK